jgi:hypothetical protein
MESRPRTISNEHLRIADIPDDLDGWQEFALTFDGYRHHGSLEKCAAIANARNPVTLTEYRTCLFFEQRRWRHFGQEPDTETRAYVLRLLDGMRRLLVAGESATRS